jgi:hypothetical protein
MFLMMAILTGVKWNLSVVWICTSFKARDGKHFVMFDFVPCHLAVAVYGV